MLQLPLNILLNDSATFDNFVIGDNLQLVKRLTDLNSSTTDFIYVWGTCDSGKTHLAQAICQSFTQQELVAAYLPLDNNELSPDIFQGMSFLDLVCLDNIESVIGQKLWEVAIFNLYNELKADNKQLLIFAQEPPIGLTIKLADLQSRLTAMEVYKLEALDEQHKIELFESRAANRGMQISPDVIQFILTRYSRSVSDLVAILDKLDQSSIILQRKITIPLVKQIFDKT